MASLRMRMVLVILGLLFPLPHSFVIRKRRSVGYDFLKEESKSDPGPDDWIPEQQQRSRSELLFDPFSRGIYVPRGPPERATLGRLTIPPRPYNDDYRLLGEGEEEDELGFNGGYDGPGLIPDEEGDVDGRTKLLDKSELKSMFEKDSVKDGKIQVDQRLADRGQTDGSSKSSELTKKDVARLLGGPPESTGGLQQQHKEGVDSESRVLVGAASSNGSSSLSRAAVAAPSSSYEGVRVIEVTESEPNGQTRRQKQTQWLLSPPDLLLRSNAAPMDKTAGGGDGDDDDLEQSIGSDWRLGNVFGGGGGDDSGRRASGDVQRVTRKVKRSELSIPEEEEEDDEEGVAQNDDVELLKTYIRLQTEENRHLEQALNFAISTQVENSDAYLAGEIDQLRLAVENEEALETIRTAIRRRQQRRQQDNAPAEEDDNNGEGERGEEEEEEEEEGLPDVERDEEERIVDDDAAFAKTLLRAKLKKFLVDSAARELREGGYEDELEAGEGGGGGEEDEEGEDVMEGYDGSPNLFPKVKVLNPFTRQAVDEYRKPKRNREFEEAAEFDDGEKAMSRDADDLDITDLLDSPVPTETGQCPAVQELADDCMAARSQRLVLDAEALSLCNRHQICYLCGPVFGMTRDSCDRGYLGESERLCSGREAQCTSEAVGLYLVMAKAHRFTAPSPAAAAFGSYDVCSADCVFDYIVGESDD